MAQSISPSKRLGRRPGLSHVAAAWSAISFICIAVAGPARAVDNWTVKSAVAERLYADDNIRLEPDSQGWVFGSTTSLNVDVESRTPVLGVGLNLGLDYNRFWGPGSTNDLNSLDWLVGAGVDRRYIRTELGARAQYRRQAVRESELEDTGQTVGDAERATSEASFSAAYDVSAVDRADAVLQALYVTFEDADDNPQLNPFFATSLTTRWARKLSDRETGTAKVDFIYYDSENAADTTSQSVIAGGLYEVQVTPRLKLLGGAGFGFVNEQRDAGNRGRVSSLSPALNFELGAIYTLERTTIEASLIQNMEPSAGGNLRQQREARVDFAYRTSETTTLNLAALHISQRTDPDLSPVGDFDREYTSAEAGLLWRILPALNLFTGYRFRYEDDEPGTAYSHAVFAGLRYAFDASP